MTRPWGPGLTFLVEVQDGVYGTLSWEDAQEAVRRQVWHWLVALQFCPQRRSLTVEGSTGMEKDLTGQPATDNLQ